MNLRKKVEDYLAGNGGYRYLADKYHVSAMSNLKKWIDDYQAFGDESLFRSRHNEIFSFDYKLHVVKLYLTNEVSYRESAIQEKNNLTKIIKWVNDFRIAGQDALRLKSKSRIIASDRKGKCIIC